MAVHCLNDSLYSLGVYLMVHIYIQGKIMFNGHEVMEEDIANTGYVLQLATPYYEELTVCENLTLAAQIKLPGSTPKEKFERVELVMKMVKL